MLNKLFSYFYEILFGTDRGPGDVPNEFHVDIPSKTASVVETELDSGTESAAKIPVTEMMRLLHTRNLTFVEFPVSQVPDYAILSHKWVGDEVTYSDMLNLTNAMKQTDGYRKIVNCCKQAASVGLDCECQQHSASV